MSVFYMFSCYFHKSAWISFTKSATFRKMLLFYQYVRCFCFSGIGEETQKNNSFHLGSEPQMSYCPFMTWDFKLKQRFNHIKTKQVGFNSSAFPVTWIQTHSIVEYCISASWLINAAFRMFHHSNAYKSKAIHLKKIPNVFLSLKGQTGNRECQRESKRGRAKEIWLWLTQNNKPQEKKHTNDLKAFCPLGCSLSSNSRWVLQSSDT